MYFRILLPIIHIYLSFALGDAASLKSVPYKGPEPGALERVVLLHRHGDRSQISPAFEPHIPYSNFTTELWNRLMPTLETKKMMGLLGSARLPQTTSLDDQLYTGHDRDTIPYGQLTEIGAQQLYELGVKLNERYKHHFQLDLQALHLRSTNFCRTLQSLKALLTGLLTNQSDLDGSVPVIHAVLDIQQEVMIPQDAHCPHILRTKRIEIHDSLRKSLPGYRDIEEKLPLLINKHGYLPWMDLYEVLVCLHAYHQHFANTSDFGGTGWSDFGDSTPQKGVQGGILLSDVLGVRDFSVVESVVTSVWQMMYQDKSSNRIALGRFFHELLENTLLTHAAKPLHIYSAHDVTLAAFLAALDLFDGRVPPYASYVAIEVIKADSSSLLTENHEETHLNRLVQDEKTSAECRQRVRIVYNDQVLLTRMGDEYVEYTPYCLLIEKLREVAISPEEHSRICRKNREKEAGEL
eukprot:gene32246-39001_t